MRIAIISTGDELLRGAIADTNAAWMASRLFALGRDVSRIAVVGDDEAAIASVLETAFAEHDLVVVGGGLGPTDDDVTAAAAAAACSLRIARNEEAARQVEAAFARLGRPMNPQNLKQADLPEGCLVLENDIGTAPGFALATARGRAVFLPGVPFELEPMFERHVLADLERAAPRHRSCFQCFGMGESNIQAALKPLSAAHPDVRFAFRVMYPEIAVACTAREARELAVVEQEVVRLLGDAIFAREEIGLPVVLGRALAERGRTLGCAESCTGGLIGHSITEVPGASAYFRGAVVAYDDAVKTSLLGVDPAALAAYGAVSEPVVRRMAEGARQALGADFAVATSGIAGPAGGTPDKPVGLVHMAVAGPSGVAHKSRVFPAAGRSRVKRISAWTAMRMALRHITEER